MGLVQDIPPAEFAVGIFRDIAVFFHAESIAENGGVLRRKSGVNLLPGPDIERALPLLVRMCGVSGAVGVLGRKEAAVGMGQIAQYVGEDIARGSRVLPVTCDLKCFQVGDREATSVA